MYKELIGKTIKFKKNIENTESDFDENMMGKIVDISFNHDLVKIWVSFSDFEEYNKKHMKCNYYDENSNPTKKWCDTTFYPINKESTEYFHFSDNLFDYFEIIEEEKITDEWIIEKFNEYDLNKSLDSFKTIDYDIIDFLKDNKEQIMNYLNN